MVEENPVQFLSQVSKQSPRGPSEGSCLSWLTPAVLSLLFADRKPSFLIDDQLNGQIRPLTKQPPLTHFSRWSGEDMGGSLSTKLTEMTKMEHHQEDNLLVVFLRISHERQGLHHFFCSGLSLWCHSTVTSLSLEVDRSGAAV